MDQRMKNATTDSTASARLSIPDASRSAFAAALRLPNPEDLIFWGNRGAGGVDWDAVDRDIDRIIRPAVVAELHRAAGALSTAGHVTAAAMVLAFADAKARTAADGTDEH